MLKELKEQNQQQQQALNALLDKGRLVWGFPRALEHQYDQHVRKKILQRVPMVGTTSVLFIVLFAVLDHFMLPPELARITSVARIFIVCPVIFLCCLWLYVKPPKFYLVPYGFAFLFGSISVVWVIWLAHSRSVLLPYEGLMITMMYGFVVMGLPIVWGCLLNAITLFAYVSTEPFYYLSFNTYVNNTMFLVAMYLAGLISAIILSHSQRNQFLQQILLNLRDERSKLDLESKNRYLAVASHDLRQPLQAINMMAEQLCHDSDDERLLKLRSGAQGLSNMFDQMLDASKINLELMELHPEPVELNPLLQQTINAFSLAYEKHNIQLHYTPCSYWVQGDYGAIQRIVNNLLQNALVHSGATEVLVRAYLEQGSVALSIKDNGKGIAPEQQAQAFEEFNQLDSPNKDQGLGVGLSIVNNLAKAMNYELSLHSDHGCEFLLSMALSKPLNEHANHLSHSSAHDSKILIIEDDAVLSEQYKSWFDNWQWPCRFAVNVHQGKQALAEKPAVIITDWHLPDGNGEGILKHIEQLKQSDSHYQPKVFVISNHGNLQNVLSAYDACQYLSKPITPSRLRAAMQGVLT